MPRASTTLMNLYLMCGLAFAGKSTLAAALAEQTGAVIVSLDEINAGRGLQGGTGIPDIEWSATHRLALRGVEDALAVGRDVIVDDTNCFRFLRENYRAVGRWYGATTTVVHVDAALELALQRARANDRLGERPVVSESILLDLARQFETPDPNEAAVVIPATGDAAESVRLVIAARSAHTPDA